MKKQTLTLRYALPFTAAVLLLAGCRGTTSEDPPIHLNRNMDTQEKYIAQRSSGFFADGKAMRTPPEGTVARGHLREDNVWFSGKNDDGSYAANIPFTVDDAVQKRGAERFSIYCSPCHGFAADGKGKIMEYKYPIPPTNLYEQRIYDMADGNIFETISNGIRNMPSYRQQIPVRDRWCIVSHVRSLQAQGTPVPTTATAAVVPSTDSTQTINTNSTETAQ
jgi:mono/diheme cytochrome c family protein